MEMHTLSAQISRNRTRRTVRTYNSTWLPVRVAIPSHINTTTLPNARVYHLYFQRVRETLPVQGAPLQGRTRAWGVHEHWKITFMNRVNSNLDATERRKGEKVSSGKSNLMTIIWIRFTKFQSRNILQFSNMRRLAGRLVNGPLSTAIDIWYSGRVRWWRRNVEDIRSTTRDSPVPGRLPGYKEGWMRFIDWGSIWLTRVKSRCFTGNFQRTSEKHV